MDVTSNVQSYYGETLQSTADLRTDACTTAEAPSPHVKAALAAVHDEVMSRYYGCGLAIPTALEGLRVLDLGCGAGRDVFALSKLVGPEGEVVGVDMTKAQLDVARRHASWHADRFGYAEPNTRFVEGELEHLDRLDLEPETFDLIISNCVINLCADKPAVFGAAHRLLRPGGELYFSDVYADRRVPQALVEDPVLYGECLSGALYWTDFHRITAAAGFADARVVDHRRLGIVDAELAAKVDPIRFASITTRLFKLEGLETACEDYGQAVIYRGGIEGMERVFVLDAEHTIEAGRVFPVCGNTLAMLRETRFAPYFDVVGEGTTHLGLFPGCEAPDVFAEQGVRNEPAAGGCC
ncbi:MAG: methyltransferase domain-containing protein [Myxococcota bacterium]